MNKSLKVSLLLFFLIIFTTYVPKNVTENKSLIFPIKEIQLKNAKTINKDLLSKELSFLLNRNILFIDETKIELVITQFDFVSSFSIKKIYPNILQIYIKEKIPVAIYADGKKKFFLTEKGEKVEFQRVKKFQELPLVFGTFTNFENFFSDLKKIDFPINSIKSFHYLEIGRWDISLKNDKIIKLPKENYQEILKNFLTIYNDNDFKKYKLFDYRIKGQLILN